MYIVELEEGVWLAPWDGDPGRTLIKQNAHKFQTKGEAFKALIKAMKHRPFPHAEVKVC